MMSQSPQPPEGRLERMARYKEERRRQLAAQFGHSEGGVSSKYPCRDSSSSDGGPRTTKTSRLRTTAAKSQDNLSSHSQPHHKVSVGGGRSSEITTPTLSGNESRSAGSRRLERDKSSKRKSNLNRALNSEEVPPSPGDLSDDPKGRRRRRRFFPSEVLEQTPTPDQQSDNLTASQPSSNLNSPISASARAITKKSELRVHMENARRGLTPAYSEMGKYKPFAGNKRAVTSSPRTPVTQDKETATKKDRVSMSDSEEKRYNRNIAKRMEQLTAFTRETLARVEVLASKTKDSPRKISVKPGRPSSILKKKSFEEPPLTVEPVPITNPAGPVSILKRKVSQDDHRTGEGNVPTPPVTFSPSVVEPATTNRKQGILKKRRSLDESQVLRHRSCSPDVAKQDSRSILKNQRRSSLEELTRIQSPETHLQGILKRKTSRNDDDDHSLNSPQGILKRRSGASSAGSTNNTPHVSITTAVILAAAGGAEIILDPDDSVKPILKKKSLSEEHPYNETASETPKPILKKKSSTDTDDCEDKPKKPILKPPRSDEPNNNHHQDDSEYRPILKQNREETSLRPRLSFCGTSSEESTMRQRASRRSHTICSDFNVVALNIDTKEEDRLLRKPRPLSVHELVMSFEQSSTGAIPKRVAGKRNSDRYRTQPVTSTELEASLNSIKVDPLPKHSPSHRFLDAHSLLDFSLSLDDDSHLNNASFLNTSPDSGVCGKMSSDSAFQSLGDGLELEEEGATRPKKLEPTNLEMQMKAIAEEAKRKRLGKGNAGLEKYKSRGGERQGASRFSTQPVTFEEVQEATRMNNEEDSSAGAPRDPSRLSLSQKIEQFNLHSKPEDLKQPRRSLTQISLSKVESARLPSRINNLALDALEKKRGILKPNPEKRTTPPSSQLKSSMKPRRSILKDPDEGISCNDSGSDSEMCGGVCERKLSLKKCVGSGDTTSDGESSGGREVKRIFQSDNKLKIKQTLESMLGKSKSQEVVGNAASVSSIAARAKPTATNLRRSQTESYHSTNMPRKIDDLRAKLQESGESEWKKRVPLNNNATDELKRLKEKNRYNDELSITNLAAKKDELDHAAEQWKSRVEKSDAEKFTVAGRMEKAPTINIPSVEKKRAPQRRFKSKEGSSSTPVSPEKSSQFDLTRSKSVPEPSREFSASPKKPIGKIVEVPRPDDYTFRNFYKSLEQNNNVTNQSFVDLKDLDEVQRETGTLLVLKKNVQVRKRRGGSKNPIKALATRTDICNEYTEVITGVAEREKKRLNVEKLAKNSQNLAMEALAGLASKVDFTSVALKKPSGPTVLLPYKPLMLLQVKGRKRVQTRLVEPVATSINEGDNFLLITPEALYNYTGELSNVIEQSRASDIAHHILKTGVLGCKVNRVLNVCHKDQSKNLRRFWEILGSDSVPETVIEGGHPDEDDIYEGNILGTNMVYTVEGDELVPFDACWGAMPRVEMLEERRVFIFDFGTEMYVWSGKNAALDEKKLALGLAKEMWSQGYNYSECNVNPLNIASVLGDRSEVTLPMSGTRPSWSLFAKVTQHRETVLFREKFLDWPDFSRVIQVKTQENPRETPGGSYKFQPGDVEEMLEKSKNHQPDLVINTMHLGRGDCYFDEETRRLFQYETLELKGWRIENTYEQELDNKSIGQFYTADSYIYLWRYRSTVKGRELNGNPSKFAAVGRESSAFFCWQGSESSVNEKCTAAFLTVQLDTNNAPQVRIVQGSEPAAFLRLFNGRMVIHLGKPGRKSKARLFLLRGEVDKEIYLMEVPSRMSSLRSRTSFVLLEDGKATIWHGAKSNALKRKAVKDALENLQDKPVNIVELSEGSEGDSWFEALGNERNSYMSLLDCKESSDYTLRMFHMTSITGEFRVNTILCPHRSEYSSPYPFVQSELFSASQPAIFLIDNNHELWLWQGWWPEKEEEDSELSDQTGSGVVRWHAERRTAMQTAINYWKARHENASETGVPAYLVWAGLEPLEFTNLFPTWSEREDVAELNLKEGKKSGEKTLLETELALLSRTTFSLEELLQRPLPMGVDPTHLEIYLSAEDFEKQMSMTKEQFEELALWKQTALKKENGLF